MSLEERQFFKDHFERQDKMLEEIHRAVYGEPKNEVPGVISRVQTLENGVKKLFSERSKIIWIGTGALGVITGLIEIFKLFF